MRRGLQQLDLVAAAAEDECAFEAGGTGADHGDAARRGRRLHPLRMPAAAVFLQRRRILRADDRDVALEAGDALVAADALADVVEPAFVDLVRQEGIGDRGTGAADDVALPAAQHAHHLVGIGEPADVDDGNLGDLLHVARPRRLMIGLVEARRTGILAPFLQAADVHVPEVDEAAVGDQLDEGEALIGRLDALRARELVDGEAVGNGGGAVHRRAHRLEDFQPQAGAVLERAAIAVGAAVEMARERLHRQRAVGAVQIDDVEAGIDGAARGLGMHGDDAAQVRDLGLVGVGVGHPG
jgi:hypothetical protein